MTATDKYRFIVVEGPIGAGKTSLTRILADRFQATPLLEAADSNPFLPKFYIDMQRYALSTQLFFLFQRAEQLRELMQLDLFGAPVIADFMLDKDPLFARLTLTDDEYLLYQNIYQYLHPQTPAPDLVIYLQASVNVLMDRVRRRGINFEFNITEEYLTRLNESYSTYFYQYSGSPLLIVNNDHLNFVDEPGHVDMLLERIEQHRGGTEFFNRTA